MASYAPEVTVAMAEVSCLEVMRLWMGGRIGVEVEGVWAAAALAAERFPELERERGGAEAAMAPPAA